MADEKVIDLTQEDELLNLEAQRIKNSKGEEHDKAIQNYKVLSDIKNQRIKIEYEHDEKFKQRLMDHDHWEKDQEYKVTQQNLDVDSKNVEFDIKIRQNKIQNIIGWATVGTTLGLGVLGLALNANTVTRVLTAEQTGVITSLIGRNIVPKIIRN